MFEFFASGSILKARLRGEMIERFAQQLHPGPVKLYPVGRVSRSSDHACGRDVARGYAVQVVRGNVERIDCQYAHRAIWTGLARRGFIDGQQLNHAMTCREREVSHRKKPTNLATPKVFSGAQR